MLASQGGSFETAAADGEEARLLELTQSIKVQLTMLLNLPSVRGEDAGGEWRGWVQDRLMDVEVDLRRLRRANCRRLSLGE